MTSTYSRRALLGSALAASVAALTAKVADVDADADAPLPVASISPSQAGLDDGTWPSPLTIKGDYSAAGLEQFKRDMLSSKLPVIAVYRAPTVIHMRDPAVYGDGDVDTLDLGGTPLSFAALGAVAVHLRVIGGVTDWHDVRVLVHPEERDRVAAYQTNFGNLRFVIDDTLEVGNAYVVDASVVTIHHLSSLIDARTTLWLSDFADYPHRVVHIANIGR